jgi:Skp family chaperone for outer membrane proteins
MNITKIQTLRILPLTLAGLLLAAGASSALAQPKIAIVDLKKVFDGYWKT